MAGSTRTAAGDLGGTMKPSRKVTAGFAAICLLVVCVSPWAASALADNPTTQTPGLPTSAQIIDMIEAEEESGSVQSQPTDLTAAESLPHQDLGRDEALELLQGVFGAQLQEPAGIFDELEVEKFLAPNVAVVAGEGSPTPVPGAQEPEPPLSDESESSVPMTEKEKLRAQSPSLGEESKVAPSNVSEEQGELEGALLLDSSIPLRTEASPGNPEAVDLSLEHTEGEIQPANPLVEVGIPQKLSEGIELPGLGVTIELAGAPEERAASIVDQSVGFLPNVATDTDLAIAPTPTGVETLTQLRSADAPHSQTFNLDLPPGASLHATKEGGAVVTDGEEALISVTPPTAIDAAGVKVPVGLDVSGDSLTLTVSPGESTRFPVLLDPLYQNYEWAKSNYWQSGICNSSIKAEVENKCNNREEWGYEHTEKLFPGHLRLENRAYSMFLPVPQGTPGLFIEAKENLTAGDQGGMVYTVPRYFTDPEKYKDSQGHGESPTSFISHMTLWNLAWEALSGHLSPYLVAGIWDPAKNESVSFYSHDGLNGHSLSDMGYQYQFPNDTNPNPNLTEYDTHARIGYVKVQASETQSEQYADAYVGSASIELADNDVPALIVPSGPSQWVNQTSAPVPFTAADSGLGVQSLTTSEQSPGLHSWKTSYGCIGVGDAACPRTWLSTEAGHPALKYEPALMPQGVDYLGVVAEDPVGNKSAPTYVPIKVDHTAPTLTLSGTATEQEALGTKRPSYTLKVNAADGTTGQPQSGVAKVSIEFDGKLVVNTEPGCSTSNCAIPVEMGIESSKFSAGQHTAKVTATDAVGLTTTKTLMIELQPSPPSLTLSGAMTEQGTLGMTRPRYKLKESASAEAGVEGPPVAPTYGSSFGAPGAANGQFAHPGDVALDAKGNLWVVDVTNNRVEQFNEKGEYLTKLGATGSGNGQFSRPTSLAIDAKGNIWVTDSANNRIQEFNEKGEFLKAVGVHGSGNGQFSAPEGIAIDPKGNIWVADTYNGRLQELNEKGEFIKVVGTKGSATGQLIEPTGIDVASNGNVWVADWANNRVEVYNEAGEYVRQFGSQGTGSGQFTQPDALAIDTKGNVWVGDAGNSRVQEFNLNGEYMTKFGSAGSGTGQFKFEYPMGIAVDSKGSLWITDTGNNRVQKWLIPGYAPAYSSSFGALGTAGGQFSHPAGIAISKGNLWVVDLVNKRVEKFNEAGEYQSSFGSSGTGNGQFSRPTSLAIDAKGNIWVADSNGNRIQEFNEKGEFLKVVGSAGTGNGQFSSPEGIAIDPKGNIWVTDRFNGRLQEFNEKGEFLKVVGTYGTGTGQLGEPVGLDIGPGGNVWVADLLNNRITVFSESGAFVRQFGSKGTGNGQLSQPNDVDVDVKGNVWVGDKGNSRIEEFNQSGTYITQVGTAGSGSGQFSFGTPMGIAADAKGNIWIADTANNRVQRWVQSNWHSEIKTEITVDGKKVDSGEAGCIGEQCSITREWALESSAYTVGKHTVVAKGTDGLGNTTTKTLTIEVQRDTTKPTLQVSGGLVEAPEGWVEQQSYGLNASAGDAGYGVTSLAFRIDGQQVASASQACADGGCPETLSKPIDISAYSGGAHAGELIATDGVGNATTQHWTINVDPEGHITATEAEETLEAVEDTSESTVVAPTSEIISPEERADGNDPSLIEGKQGLESSGTPDPSTISLNPEGGFTVHLPEGLINAKPVVVGEGATSMVVAEEAVAVGGNTMPNVDGIIRPIFNGLLTFGSIRDASVPETFSWKVNLGSEQLLKLVDPQHAEVDYLDGHEAYLVTAEPASDAVGTTVPTSLSVSEGSVLSLTVKHKESSYVYPVVAGAGWEGGFHTEIVVGPKDQQELNEEKERILHEEWEAMEHATEESSASPGGAISELDVSAPEPASSAEAEVEDLALWRNQIEHLHVHWITCEKIPEIPDVHLRSSAFCGNPFTNDPGENDVAFNYGVRADYYLAPGFFAKHKGGPTSHIECDKMYDSEHIENQGIVHWNFFIDPAVQCKWYGHTKYSEEPYAPYGRHLTPFGEWHWGSGSPQHWTHHTVGLALYIWASKDGYVGLHRTTCIDC